MDTIYTHNISAKEMQQIIRMIPGRKIPDKPVYEESVPDDLRNADLFRLYSLRNDQNRAKNYLDKIKDEVLRYLLID